MSANEWNDPPVGLRDYIAKVVAEAVGGGGTLRGLSDVEISAPAANEVLKVEYVTDGNATFETSPLGITGDIGDVSTETSTALDLNSYGGKISQGTFGYGTISGAPVLLLRGWDGKWHYLALTAMPGDS